MRRNLVAFGALALGWLAGPASAQELIPTPPLPSHVISNNEPPTALPGGPAGGGAAAKAPAATAVTPAPTIVGSPVYYDECGHGDDRGGRGWRIYAGADALYLRPHFNNNPGLSINTEVLTFTAVGGNNTTQTSQRTNSTQDFVYDWSVSPRFWVGIENCNGLGVRGRYFRFDQGADPQTAASVSAGQFVGGLNGNGTLTSTTVQTPGFTAATLAAGANITVVGDTVTFTPNPDPVFASSSLYLDVFDVEVTQAWRGTCWNIILSGGARYAYIEQTSNFVRPGVISTVTEDGLPGLQIFASDSLLSRQTFNGAGPMLALEVERKLGCSGFSLFGTGRGALLFGKSRTRSQSLSTIAVTEFELGVLDNSQVILANESNEQSRFDLLPVAELELGVQWSRCLGNIEVFARGAGVAQVYFDGGNPQSRNFDFGLFGAVATVGFRF